MAIRSDMTTKLQFRVDMLTIALIPVSKELVFMREQFVTFVIGPGGLVKCLVQPFRCTQVRQCLVKSPPFHTT